MKNILLTLSIFIAILLNTAMAEMNTDKKMSKKGGSNPMAVFKSTSPMPLLMSVIVKNADELKLSEKQNAVFTQWRVDNMMPSLTIGNEIIAEEEAIAQASLDGKPNVEIEKMLSSVLKKRHTLASNMMTCRDMIVKTLDSAQWEKLVGLHTTNSKKMMHAH